MATEDVVANDLPRPRMPAWLSAIFSPMKKNGKHRAASLRRTLSLMEKELKAFIKDPMAIIIMFLIPVIVVFLLTFGIAQDGSIINAPAPTEVQPGSGDEIPMIGLIDLDSSEGFPGRDLSGELFDLFLEAENLQRVSIVHSTNQSYLEEEIFHGRLHGYVVIPNNFEYNLSIHFPAIITLVIDTLDTMQLMKVQEVVDEVVSVFKERNSFDGVFNVEEVFENLPERNTVLFGATPFFFPMILFGVCSLTATQSIVSDVPKDRMVLTPTNKWELMTAKVLANQVLATALIAVLVFTSLALGLEVRCGLFDLFIVFGLASFNAILIGVAISAISKTPLSALQYFIFMFLFQAIILLFVEDPFLLALMPLHNSVDMTMKIVMRGQNYWTVRHEAFNILAECLFIYFIAFIYFKRQKTLL
jgi:hypothetical protein